MRDWYDSAATQSLYEKLINEEDARVCEEVSESACEVVPGNFLLLLSASILTKLGDAITSPKTVLAWIAASTGAPPAVLGLLVPIRESGSLIPQLLIGGVVRRLEVRKWAWVAGSLLQALAVLGMAWSALTLNGEAAGTGLLGCLVLFSLARGLCSVAAKDVLGKTVPKGRRGQLTGWASSAAGLISAVVGGLLLAGVADGGEVPVLAGLLVVAAFSWLVACLVYALVREPTGATEGGVNGIRDALANLMLLVEDGPFRRFVLARSLLMCSALSAPFYVALAHQQTGAGSMTLGAFIIAGGTASLVSAPVWGRLADSSSRKVMFGAACLCAVIGAVVFLLGAREARLLEHIWVLPLAYFVLSVAHSGVRVGRKTYVVDLAEGNRRTDYVSVSNTVIGVLLLVAGMTGLLADRIGNHGMVGLLALMGLIGAILAWKLPET
jgi:MFS family permease